MVIGLLPRLPVEFDIARFGVEHRLRDERTVKLRFQRTGHLTHRVHPVGAVVNQKLFKVRVIILLHIHRQIRFPFGRSAGKGVRGIAGEKSLAGAFLPERSVNGVLHALGELVAAECDVAAPCSRHDLTRRKHRSQSRVLFLPVLNRVGNKVNHLIATGIRSAGPSANVEQGQRCAQFLGAVYQRDRMFPNPEPFGIFRTFRDIIVTECVAVVTLVGEQVCGHKMFSSDLEGLIEPLGYDVIPMMSHSVRVYVGTSDPHRPFDRHLSASATIGVQTYVLKDSGSGIEGVDADHLMFDVRKNHRHILYCQMVVVENILL